MIWDARGSAPDGAIETAARATQCIVRVAR